MTITPDECIKCRLCEESCPFGAINKPTVEWPAAEYAKSKKRLKFQLILLPVLVIFFGLIGSLLSPVTARAHATVRLAEQVHREDAGQATETTDASDAFRATGKTTKELYAEASEIRSQFALGGWFFGGFVGLVIGLKLIRLGLWRRRTDYEADAAGCVSCGRCFDYCPREHLRLKREWEAKSIRS